MAPFAAAPLMTDPFRGGGGGRRVEVVEVAEKLVKEREMNNNYAAKLDKTPAAAMGNCQMSGITSLQNTNAVLLRTY